MTQPADNDRPLGEASAYAGLPRREAAVLDYPVTIPADLVSRSLVSGRRVRRQRRALVGVGSLTFVAAIAVAVPVLTPTHRSVSLSPAAGSPPAVSTPAQLAVTPAISTTPPANPGPSTSAKPSPGETERVVVPALPAHFLAAIGKAETVIATTTGVHLVLPVAASTVAVVSDDGKTLWTTLDGGTSWQATDVATGVMATAAQFSGDSEFAVSTQGTVAAEKHLALQVKSASIAVTEDPHPQWSADGKHLVIEGGPGVEVLQAKTLTVTESLTAAAGCAYARPHFLGDQTIVVALNCPTADSVVILDSTTGQQLSSIKIATADAHVRGIESLDVDSAGNVIVAVLTNNSTTDGSVYTMTADGAVASQGTTGASQVSWLGRQR